jgi:hypothetical protein
MSTDWNTDASGTMLGVWPAPDEPDAPGSTLGRRACEGLEESDEPDEPGSTLEGQACEGLDEPGSTLGVRLSGPDEPGTPPGKRRRLHVHQPTVAKLRGCKFLYATVGGPRPETQRITAAVCEWAKTQPQFETVCRSFHVHAFATNLVDNILSFQGTGATAPIMAVKACIPKHVSMSFAAKDVMQPPAPKQAQMTIAESVLEYYKDTVQFDFEPGSLLQAVSDPFQIKTETTCPPPSPGFDAFEVYQDSSQLDFEPGSLLHALPDPSPPPGFDAFYGGKDVEMPTLPTSKGLLHASLAQDFLPPKLLCMAVAIETARHLINATVIVLNTTREVCSTALELDHLFHKQIKIAGVLFGQGPNTDPEKLNLQRVEVRATLQQLGVVICVREPSAIRELMDTLAEIKNDKESVLGKMIMHRLERHNDSFTFKILQASIELIKERQKNNMAHTKNVAAARLEYQMSSEDAKKVPVTTLSDELRLANKKRAVFEINRHTNRYYSKNSDNQVVLKGTIWTRDDVSQTAREHAHQIEYAKTQNAKLWDMKAKWSDVGDTPLPTCLGIIMITDDFCEGDLHYARQAAASVNKETQQTPLQDQDDIRELMRSFTGHGTNDANKIDTVTPHLVVSLCGRRAQCVWAPNEPYITPNGGASGTTHHRALQRSATRDLD